MNNACIIRPNNTEQDNVELFDSIKSSLKNLIDNSSDKSVYKTTWDIYYLALSEDFRNKYKETLSFDAKGFPTLKSLMSNELVQAHIGTTKNKALASVFKVREDTRENYNIMLEEALTFNKEHSSKIAYVEEDNGKLRMVVKDSSPATIKIFQEQYAANKMADEIVKLLAPLGIQIGDILGPEAQLRNGKIDFNKAQEILEGTKQLVMVANNMRGTHAISEEFAHLIVGTLNSPIKDRLIARLAGNENAIAKILGDEYLINLEMQGYDLTKLAEECLGKMLQNHLVTNKMSEVFKDTQEEDVEDANIIVSLFNRLRNFILNFFKHKSPDDINDLIVEANNAMSDLAKNIQRGNVKLSKAQIAASKRDAIFNDLNTQIQRTVEVLNQAEDVEEKRRRIYSKSAYGTSAIDDILTKLSGKEAPNADQLRILYDYMKYAIDELNVMNQSASLIPTLVGPQKFQTIRRIHSYLESFAPIIDELYKAYREGMRDPDGNILDGDILVDGGGGTTISVNLYDVLKNFNDAHKSLQSAFDTEALPAFAEFVKPFIGEIRDERGNLVDIENLLKKKVGDISLLDRWLDTMANSSDQVLQMFDSVQRAQNDKAREKSIDDIRRVQAWQKKCDRANITDFEWMFEHIDGHKTGDYVQPIMVTKFMRDLEAFNKYLADKYEGATDLTPMYAEKDVWLLENARLDARGGYIPNPAKYTSEEYAALSDTQRDLLNEYLQIKSDLDRSYPGSATGSIAIQLRRDNVQRNIDLLKNPSQIVENVKEAWRSLSEVEDDDARYGTSAVSGFNGRQWDFLPILYKNRLKNPDEISTDVARALVAYAVSSNQYAASSETVDALEVGRMLVEQRKTVDTVDDKPKEETYWSKGVRKTREVYKSQTNAIDKLNEWFDSAVYQKYYAQELGFKIPFTDKTVDAQKFSGALMGLASSCQLAFNWAANSANVATGIAMTNIEVAAGKWFKASELAAADKDYFTLMPEFFGELNSRYPKGKLSLFCELFNVHYNFDNAGKEMRTPSAWQRIFGKNVAYLGQDGGDHWLYSRISIAMAKHKMVQVPNGNGGYRKMSVWDALQIKDSSYDSELKEMFIPAGTLNEDGTEFNVGKFSRQMGEIHHRLFGVYNTEDRVAAQRHVMGKLIMMYRQWIKPQFNYRWQKGEWNQTLGEWEEGYWRTGARIVKELRQGQRRLGSVWSSLEDWEKENIKRGICEFCQYAAVWALATLVPWGKDKDRSWWLKYVEYMAKREEHELGNLTPSLTQIRELIATVKSPSAVLGVITPMIDFTSSLIDPLVHWTDNDWFDEKTSGRYKGHSTLYRNFMKLPVPAVQWYNQIDKFTGTLEDKINYYARNTQY